MIGRLAGRGDISKRKVGNTACLHIKRLVATYLKGVMNDNTIPPVKAWKAEYTKLIAEHKTLNQRYFVLKDEVKEAEQIRKSVYSILSQEQREKRMILIDKNCPTAAYLLLWGTVILIILKVEKLSV